MRSNKMKIKNELQLVTIKTIEQLGMPTNTAKSIFKEAKQIMVCRGVDYYNTSGIGHVPREAVEVLLGSPLIKLVTKETLIQMGIPDETAQNIMRNAKRIMVNDGFPIYNNRRLQLVPCHILESILGITFPEIEVN